MAFIGSSELWGEDGTARLCQILLDANDGMAQQVSENRHDLLDLLSLKELRRVDDCGLSLPYLAVHYDRPDMIRYLHKRGLDFSVPCDPMEYGTPMFYAVNMGKIHCVEALDSIGVSVSYPCDVYVKLTPTYYASRIGDPSVGEKIERLLEQEVRAGELFMKNFAKRKERKKFLRIRNAAIVIQKFTRGLLDRIMVRLVRSGAITLDSNSVHSGDSVTGSQSTSHGHSRSTSRAGSKASKATAKSAGSKPKHKVKEPVVNFENSIDSLSVESSLF